MLLRSLTPIRRTSARTLHLLILAAVLTAVPLSAAAAPKAAPPQLSISVDDGQPSATAGDTLSYTLTVTNLGTERIKNLLVTQTVPATSRLVSADSRGVKTKTDVTWKVNLDATAKVVLHTKLAVLSSPDEVLRFATIACAKVSAKSAPLVCASDSNQLPAGAAAQAQSESPPDASWWSTPHLWWYIGGGLAVLVVAFAVAYARSRRQPPGAGTSTGEPERQLALTRTDPPR